MLIEELSGSLDPWSVACRLSTLPHLLFLDSAEYHEERGRYSFVTALPSRFHQIHLSSPVEEDPFTTLQAELAEFSIQTIEGLPPFQGGFAGLFGYGLAHAIERVPRNRFDEFRVPDLAVGLYDWVISFDHREHRCWMVSTGIQERNPKQRADAAAQRIKEIQSVLNQPSEPKLASLSGQLSSSELAPQYPLAGFPKVTSNFSRGGYLDAIRRAVEYVHAGDCFQVNIAQRLLTPLREDPLRLYQRLREENPAPFGGYFDLGDFVLASASPERFLKVQKGEVETRPIKGTRPRSTDPEEETRLIADLQSNPKDRAENIMIVDLLRNDLGRVCEYGSIQVPRICEVESFRYVHHLVSEVRGKLRENQTSLDLLRASFPGGSVTGAPKVRAMEIIAELEPTARGPYCGCLGYLGFDGSMDTNILIRTFTAGKGWLQFPVGGGIVADSIPEREYEETLDKAVGLLRAL